MRRAHSLLLLLACPVSLFICGAANPLSRQERVVERFAAAAHGDTVALLTKFVSIGSSTEDSLGIRAVGELAATRLRADGFEVGWVTPAAGRPGHLVATRQGEDGAQTVTFMGHIDTVHPGPGSSLRIEGDRAWGPGVHDDLGGVVVLLGAIRALTTVPEGRALTVRVFLTGDEESPAEDTAADRAPLVALARGSDAVLSFEGYSPEAPGLVIARRGIAEWTLNVEATGGHSSRVGHELGYGAAYELSREIDLFRSMIDGNITLNVGVLASGTDLVSGEADAQVRGKKNVVPKVAWARGDLRYLHPGELVFATTAMKQAADTPLSGSIATVSFRELLPPLPPTDASLALVAEASAVDRALGGSGFGAVDPLQRGAGDICFLGELAGQGVPVVDGLGLDGGGDHDRTEEWADLSSLDRAVARAAIVALRVTKK